MEVRAEDIEEIHVLCRTLSTELLRSQKPPYCWTVQISAGGGPYQPVEMDSSRGVLGMVLLMAVLCPSVLGQRCVFMGSCLFDKNIDKSVPCAVDQDPMEKLPDAQWTEFAVSATAVQWNMQEFSLVLLKFSD